MQQMGLKQIDVDQVSYYDLNNEINIPVDGQIPLKKDQAALTAFLAENVKPNLLTFSSLKEKLNYLIENNYYENGFIEKIRFFIH